MFALLVPSVVAGLVTFSWFPWNRYLAAGDVTPFLRDGDSSELFDLWNHRVTGAGAASPAVVRALEVIVIRSTSLFGGSDMVAQHVFYALVMAFAAFGAAYLARSFVRDPIAVGAAGLLGSLNVFILVHLPNPLTMIWLGLVAVCGGMIVRAARGAPLSVISFAAVTLIASYLSLNPPLLATATVTLIGVACAATLLVGPGGTRRAWKFLARAAPWTIGFNLWWLVPTALATGSRQGLVVTAVTRVEDWSWSQARNSIPNLLSFTAHWGWVYPQYMPFAHSLDTYPWALFRWSLPTLAVTALFLVRGRRRIASWTLVAASVVALFLAKGLHWPFESVNLWAYQHVPGLWLLRDPFNKVAGVILLSMVVLAAMTIEIVRERASAIDASRAMTVAVGVVAVAACSAIAFPYPLWTGAVGPNGKDGAGLPSIRVAVPSAWHNLANTLNASSTPGKALVLPLDPFYQVTTTWGYHGSDTLPIELLSRPVLSLLPGGYYTPAGLLPQMLRSVEQDILHHDNQQAAKLLQVLGVSYVVLRHDLALDQVVRTSADPAALARGLTGIPGVSRARSFGVADVYSVAAQQGTVWTATQVTGLVRRDNTRMVDALSALPTRGVAVNPATTPVDDLSWEAPDQPTASTTFTLRNSGSYEISLGGTVAKHYHLSVTEGGSGARQSPMLQVADPVRMSVDGAAVPVTPAQYIPLRSANVVGIALDGHVLTDSTRMDIDLVKPSRLEAFVPAHAPSSSGDRFSSVGDCSPRQKGTGPPTSTHITNGRRITAQAGAACVTFPGPAVSPNALYRVRFEARGSVDGAERACLWMNGPDTCAPMRPVAASRGWTTFDAAVHALPGTTGLDLYLYADATHGEPVVAQYRDVSITPLDAVGRGIVAPAVRVPVTRDLARGEHHVAFDHLVTSTPIEANSPLGDCEHDDNRTPQQAGLAVVSIKGGVQLRANAHAACVTASIPPTIVRAGGAIAVSVDVRTVRGRAARLCLWQFGPSRCAPMPAVPTTAGWTTYRTEIQLARNTVAARLFMYADGTSTGTVTEYRNPRVEEVDPEIVNVTPTAPSRAAPKVTQEKNGSGAFSASVSGASGASAPAFVVLDESFSSGWQLRGAKVLGHTDVNGYANGWMIASGGSITMRYRPSVYASDAIDVSVFVVLLACGLALYRRRRRTREARLSASSPWCRSRDVLSA